MTMSRTLRRLLVLTALMLAGPAGAQPRETAALVTEIKLRGGTAEMRAAGGTWRAATPLQALRAGDEVRATEGASIVVLLSGGRGTAQVDAKSSPFVVAAPAGDATRLQKAGVLVGDSIKFLAARPKESPKAVLATRATARPPEILTPRDGAVLPGPFVVEWLGSQFSRYTVRITGPSDVVVERKGVAGARFAYPADAPALRPGVRYQVQVEALNQKPQRSTFEVLDPARAATVEADLRELEAALGPGASPSSAAVARAGYLAEHGLLHDARLTVLSALGRDPDEPVLHTLLGTLYLQTGLRQLAAESFDEAQFLLTRRP